MIEDEPKTTGLIKQSVESAGFSVETVDTGAAALHLLRRRVFDLIVVDLTLPDIDGPDLLKGIRGRQVTTPMLVLNELDEVADRVKCLESGADDCLVKPFAFAELIARIRALFRRSAGTLERLQVGDLVLDCILRRVTRDGQVIELAPKEFAILEYLMRNPGHALSRTMIVEHVWHLDYDGLTNIVDVYIRHLRAKVDDNFPKPMIRTVRGVGYLLAAPDKQGKDRA